MPAADPAGVNWLTPPMSPRRFALAGLAEVAEQLEVSKQRAQQLSQQPGFPAPLARLRMGPVWDLLAVREWAAARRRRLGR